MSDYDEHATVVINLTGQHKFSHTRIRGQSSIPLIYVLISSVRSWSVIVIHKLYLLDQGGQFLSILLIEEHGIYNPLIVCVGADINLNVRQYNTYKVKVYEYLSLSLSCPYRS